MNFNYEFYASFRFEIFYALQLITDDTSKIHNEWKQKPLVSFLTHSMIL